MKLNIIISATVAILLITTISGCNSEDNLLPEHDIEKTALPTKTGSRVQITLKEVISDEQCVAFIEKYRVDGEPDGQVSVHMPSKMLEGKSFPFCVENFDGKGVFFNKTLFSRSIKSSDDNL